jgi:GNAT superfamily N-acetyltransferase
MKNRPRTMQTRLLDSADGESLLSCYEVFRHLRPHLDRREFAQKVETQYAEGYRIVCLEDDGLAIAAAGYRVANFLAWGKVLYVDDLVTLPGMTERGAGGRLMDWLVAHAAESGCDQLHLDTGYQRYHAHRLYLRKGLQLGAHHMSMTIGDTAGR